MDSSFVTQCFHRSVQWYSSIRCKCQRCGKLGQWFEEAGLVIWHYGEPTENNETSEKLDARACSVGRASNPMPKKNMAITIDGQSKELSWMGSGGIHPPC